MKYEDITKLDAETLKTKIAEARRSIFETKFSKSTTGIEKPHELKILKKDVARMLTALNAKGN